MFEPPRYMLSAVVYAERDGQILLLKRADGALSGQWFLPGGAVEAGETPEAAARRELREESGLEIVDELEIVGAYPIYVYDQDCLQISYLAVTCATATTSCSARSTTAPGGSMPQACSSC